MASMPHRWVIRVSQVLRKSLLRETRNETRTNLETETLRESQRVAVSRINEGL